MKKSTKAFDIYKIKLPEYEEYCKEKELNPNSLKTKKQFFRDVLDKRIVRENGKLVRKRQRSN